MKKIFYLFIIIGLIGFFGCGKTVPDNPPCTNQPPYWDSTAILKFAADSIKLSMDSTGLYYQIIDSGNNVKPIPTSIITVNYIGRLMTGVIFDSASNTNLKGNLLKDLIPGWRIGLPKIGVGGHIKLLIPSAYGWGCTGYGPIPGNAPVYFDIKLLAVN